MHKLLVYVILPITLIGSELKFQFKSPIFNGIGYSAHILNQENISFTRKSNIAEEAEAHVHRRAEGAGARKAGRQPVLHLRVRGFQPPQDDPAVGEEGRDGAARCAP